MRWLLDIFSGSSEEESQNPFPEEVFLMPGHVENILSQSDPRQVSIPAEFLSNPEDIFETITSDAVDRGRSTFYLWDQYFEIGTEDSFGQLLGESDSVVFAWLNEYPVEGETAGYEIGSDPAEEIYEELLIHFQMENDFQSRAIYKTLQMICDNEGRIEGTTGEEEFDYNFDYDRQLWLYYEGSPVAVMFGKRSEGENVDLSDFHRLGWGGNSLFEEYIREGFHNYDGIAENPLR